MKYFAAFLIVALFSPVAALAGDTGACYNISSSDARSYCIAKARKDSAPCYNIRSADMRSMCLAEVKK